MLMPLFFQHLIHRLTHRFQFGLSFSMVLICGFLNISTGVAVLLINAMRDVKAVSTFFELDFDTPCEFKKLQEDSKNRKQSQLLAQATLSLAMPAMLR